MFDQDRDASQAAASERPSLRALADKCGLAVGAAVDIKALAEDPIYGKVLRREFNTVVAENAFKQFAVWTGPYTYDFTTTDHLAAFAQENGMVLRGHTLLWHQGIPKWLREGDYPAEEVSQMLRAYIHAFVSRYRGQVAMWDVVNEAVNDPGPDGETPGLRTDSFWYQTLGEDYLSLAFTWAHEADPEARLYYNDYESENMGPKANAVYALVRDLVERGVPIHGVGLQYHLINGWRLTEAYRANVRRIVALGLDWQVTECDIRMPLDGKPASEADLAVQAQGYHDLIRLCREEPGCRGFLVWGFTDAYSWIPGFRRGWGASLPFDEHFQPKPACDAIASALQGKPWNEDEGYAARKQEYLSAVAERTFPAQDGQKGGIFQLIPMEIFYLIPRLELGHGPIDDTLLQAALNRINERRDCADFVLAGLLRVLYRCPETPLLSPEQIAQIEQATLNFSYWYDQPGIRGMCFHTENHQILFHTCELLAGQLYPDTVFANSGKTGEWHIAQAKKRVLQWIDQRARFGFSEWLSSYYDEDLLALVSLYDFAWDPEIHRRAGMMIDILLFEVALHQQKGILGGTHGRTYAEFVQGGQDDPLTTLIRIVFGIGEGTQIVRPTLALTALATSEYRVPAILQRIAQDQPAELLCRERHGIDVADASRYGLKTVGEGALEDAMFFWACQTSRHPDLRTTALEVARIAEDPWLTNFIQTVDGPLERCKALIEEAGAAFDGDAVNTSLSAVNLVTYRTPHYLLSCAQDFRPGKPGYQQHPWQATLSSETVVFTSHPGAAGEGSDHTERPNFWAGNRWLPRAAQYRNVLVCVHHVPGDDPFPFSHAYFPANAFDLALQVMPTWEVAGGGNWTFGRKGNGYIALYSHRSAQWAGSGPYAGVELRANSRDNVWICEMGSADEWGSFEAFVAAISRTTVLCDDLSAVYRSPSQGEVRFGWTGPLTVGGKNIPLTDYPRFDNPYCQVEIGERVYTITQENEKLTWDFR